MLKIAIVELYTRWDKSIKDVPKLGGGSGRRPRRRGSPALSLGAVEVQARSLGAGQEVRQGG